MEELKERIKEELKGCKTYDEMLEKIVQYIIKNYEQRND